MPLTTRTFARLVIVACLFTLVSACARRPSPDGGVERAPRGPAVASMQMSTVYAQHGLMVGGDPIPFIGSVRYLAGKSPDSTLVLVTLSFANQSITFSSEGAGRSGRYSVATQLRRDGTPVVRADASETVRVAGVREAARADESVLFQQYLHAAPGSYDLVVAIRDEGSARNSAADLRIAVPAFAEGTLAAPIAVYEAAEPRSARDSLPTIVANPRATAVLGRDSVLPMYLEGYGLDSAAFVEVRALDERNRDVWRDTLAMERNGPISTAIASVPVARVGVGRHTITASMIGSSGSTVGAPMFVSFGEGVAIGSFDEMVSYLRFFTTPERLQPLRDTVPERRAVAWKEFLRETDPDPSTPEHEGLRAYFNRIHIANQRFREDSPAGWLSDRGKVFVTFGEPDQLLQSMDQSMNRRGRSQVWTYARYQLRLIFVDATGFGRWQLTPGSEFDFQNAVRRERARESETRLLGEQ